MNTTAANLIPELKRLVQSERKITAEIVELIKEIDRLKLYLDHGHTSMFSFLTKEMGYAPTSAIRRINAARILKDVPELKEDLKTGTINLSQASMVAEAVKQKQKIEPQKINSQQKICKDVKQDLLAKVRSLDLVQTEKLIAQELNLEVKVHEKKSFQKNESVRVEVTFTKAQWDDLTRVRELSSHQNPNPSISDLVGFLSQYYLNKKDPIRKITTAPDASVQQPHIKHESGKTEEKCPNTCLGKMSLPAMAIGGGSVHSIGNKKNERYIPQRIKNEIFKRDRCCQWKDPRTKIQCGSRFQLQIDHKKSLWRGGDSRAENLHLLCAVHNKWKYKQELRMEI